MGDASNTTTSGLAATALFTPFRLGNIQLQHRVVLAPLTRTRGHQDHTPSELAITYYEQRASFPGTLLISEGTFVAEEAGGLSCVPGIYNDKQIIAWRKITSAVHAKGSFIFCQLWAQGRAANPEELKREGHEVVSPGDIPLQSSGVQPRMLRKDELPKWVEFYVQAARNAIQAGFDGVEIHSANGYFLDQFLQDVSNNRTDEYGGSVENRCRFPLEVVKAVVAAVGQERTGIRLSPWERYQNMRMSDPLPTFSYLAQELKGRFPNMAYMHVTEPIVEGDPVVPGQLHKVEKPGEENNDFLQRIWAPKVFITCGGYNDKNAGEAVGKMGDLIAFGRWFISNPDLPLRLKNGIPLSKYDRPTFYIPGPEVFHGYTDYPTADMQNADNA